MDTGPNSKGKMLPPGSEEALKQGCRCAVFDNHYGKGIGKGMYWINADCPLHGGISVTEEAEK